MHYTSGHRLIMTELRYGSWKHEPWGTCMDALFGVAEAAWVEFEELMPGYRPSPFLRTATDLHPGESDVALQLVEYIRAGQLVSEDLHSVWRILDRYRAWCVLAGRDY